MPGSTSNFVITIIKLLLMKHFFESVCLENFTVRFFCKNYSNLCMVRPVQLVGVSRPGPGGRPLGTPAHVPYCYVCRRLSFLPMIVGWISFHVHLFGSYSATSVDYSWSLHMALRLQYETLSVFPICTFSCQL